MDKLKIRTFLTTIIVVIILTLSMFLTMNLDKIGVIKKINVKKEYELLEENQSFPSIITCDDKDRYYDGDNEIKIFCVTSDRIFVGNKNEYEVYDYAVDDIHIYVTNPDGVEAVYVDKEKFNALEDTLIQGDFVDERSENYFSFSKDGTGSYKDIATEETINFTYQAKDDTLRLEYTEENKIYYEYMGFSQKEDYIYLESERTLTLNKIVSDCPIVGEYDFLSGDMTCVAEHISADDCILLSNNRFIIKTDDGAHAYAYEIEDEYLTLRNGTASLLYIKMPEGKNDKIIDYGIYASDDALTKLVLYDKETGNLTIGEEGLDFTYTLNDKIICCKACDCNIYINYENNNEVLNISFLSLIEDELIEYQLYKVS